MIDIMSLYIVGKQVTGLKFFGFSVFSFFGIRNVIPALNHSGIYSSSIKVLQNAAICLYVAVSCLNQKFTIWSVPGAFQFSVVLSASATSFSHTGLHSMHEFCWYWFFFNPVRLSIMLNFFPYISLQKFSTSSLSSALFTLKYVCLRQL